MEADFYAITKALLTLHKLTRAEPELVKPRANPPLLQGQFKVGRTLVEPGLVAFTLQKI